MADGSALPSWLTFDTATRTFTSTPTNDDAGILKLKVIATDTQGATANSHFNLIINGLNTPPILNQAIAPQVATEDQHFSLQLAVDTFVDTDPNDQLTYTATQANNTPLPSWLVFNADTQTFAGIPTNNDLGTIRLRVTATDNDGLSTSTDFELVITNVNDAPTVANPVADQTAIEDALFTVQLPANTFNDIDAGDSLTYSATQAQGNTLPAWLSFNFTTRNDAPVLNQAIADTTVVAGNPLSFTLTGDIFNDIGAGDRLTYTAALSNGNPLPAWVTFDQIRQTFDGIPLITDVGTAEIKVTATDLAGQSVSDVFALTVNPPSTSGDLGVAPPPIDFRVGKRGVSKQGTTTRDRLNGTNLNDTLRSGNGNDWLNGRNGNDQLFGQNGNDTLLGGDGQDSLVGGSRNDRLVGGNGNDILNGDSGNDILTGGSGRDLFVYSTVTHGNDTITDFNPTFDLIDLRPVFAKAAYIGLSPLTRFNQFVQLVQVGANTEVRIDWDGNGARTTFTALATLQNVSVGAINSRNFVISEIVFASS